MRFLLRVLIFIGLKFWELWKSLFLKVAAIIAGWFLIGYLFCLFFGWVMGDPEASSFGIFFYLILTFIAVAVVDNWRSIGWFISDNWNQAGEIQSKWLPEKDHTNPHDNTPDVTVQKEG